MRKFVVFFSVVACALAVNTEVSAKDYKVGTELNDKQGVEYFKERANTKVVPWSDKKLTIDDVPKGKDGELIRYGIELLMNTEAHLGPKGKLKMTDPEVACVACHMHDDNGLPGTKKYAFPFVNSINNYPMLDIETMRIISLEDRIRGMGHTDSVRFPSNSKEMRAILAYFKWLKEAYGYGDKVKVEGEFLAKIKFPNRPADPLKGKALISVAYDLA